ncbi:MAG: M23 family metallopeptidase [Calditrichia bacterium]
MKKQPRFILVNTTSSNIKKIYISIPKVIAAFLIVTFIIFLSLKLSADLVFNLSQNSKIAQLQQQNTILSKQLSQMTETISSLRAYVDQIEQLDDKIRKSLDVPLLDDDIRKVGIGGSDIEQASAINLNEPELKSVIIDNNVKLARLEREIKLELESFGELLTTVERKEDSLRFLPAIKPVPNGRLTDGFGKRRHPILKRILPHYGIDLSADRGTPVLAPADGWVSFTGRNGAYGNYITIDHKYGYKTSYGHLQKIYVRKGQFVRRGDKIGEVGNTGRSTAPHLHYEVHYKNKPVDPIEYYFPDIYFD